MMKYKSNYRDKVDFIDRTIIKETEKKIYKITVQNIVTHEAKVKAKLLDELFFKQNK